MSIDNPGPTRTTERVEADVSTVEVIEFQCVNCRQWFEDESRVIPVALNAEMGDPVDAEEVANLCSNCAEAIFGYDGPTDGILDFTRAAVENRTPEKDVVEGFHRALFRLVIPLTVLGIVTAIGLLVMSEFQRGLESAEFQEASSEITTGVGPGATELVGTLFLILLTASLIGLLRRVGSTAEGH